VKLGPEFRWETDFLTRQPLGTNGEVRDLYVKGNGDPLLGTGQLYEIVAELYHAGLRNITGSIYLDDTAFDDQRVGPGFDQEHSDHSYMAPTGALSLNWNSVEVEVFPGSAVGQPARVELEPQSDYFEVVNQVSTVRARARGRVQVRMGKDGVRQKVEVKGRLPMDKPGAQLWRKVEQPDLYFGATLKGLLRQRGIRFHGRIRKAAAPADAQLLYQYQSPPLALAVRKMNKVSSNFIAEQLVKTLGAQREGAPGSWAKGIDVIEDFLDREVGIPRGSYVMKNGSGMNDTNRFSAAQVVKVLGYMEHHFPTAAEYLASLGIAGKDGTVESRMEGTDAEGRLRAKTGTLNSVTALSGVVESLGGQRLLFSMLVNDYPGRHAQVNAAMDDLGVAIAAAGGPVAPDQAAQQLVAGATPKPSPMAELRARVATFESLGKLHDKRNLPFLRTALRTERDPAVKAVVAEALFQSDPSDGSGARAVLDSWSAAPEVFGRLQALAREQAKPVAVVGSLLDIAADGNAEALARAVELAPLAAGDATLTGVLAEGFDQISRDAPDELLSALHGAAPESGKAALGLLVQGIAASTDTAENPFPKALAQAEGGADAELAAYAKTLESQFQTELALARAAPRPNEPTTTNTAGTVVPVKGEDKPATIEPAVAPAPKK